MTHTIILLIATLICITLAAVACKYLFRQPENPHAHARSHQLDGLRGMLACAVISHHFYYTYGWRELGGWGKNGTLMIVNLGAISVSLFFLMSAYLHLLKICRSPEINWLEFYIARIKRIYPLYIAVFLLVLAIGFLTKPVHIQDTTAFLNFTIKWLLFQNVNFQNITHLMIAGVQWTLVYEWAVYAILPLIHMIYHRKINFQAAAWIAIGLAYWVIGYHSDLQYYWLFILAIPVLILAKPIQGCLKHYPVIVHIIMLPLTYYLFFKTIGYSWEQRILLAIWFAFVAHGYSFANLLNHKGLVKLGDLSYAIYLVHGLVLFMWFGVLEMFIFKQGNFVGYVWHLPVIYVMAITLAYLGNRFVEIPFARKK
jgi:hypothetical protein